MSDCYASTHDVAPTVLGSLGIRYPIPTDGQALSVLLDGEEPEPRPHLAIGWHKYVYARDDRHVMFGRSTGRRAKLFDLREGPGWKNSIAWRNSGIVDRMFRGYIRKDAGGLLPNYDL